MNENSDQEKLNITSNIELISVISHELRTPLNIILGAQRLLELCLKENSSISKNESKLSNYLSSIKSNSYRLQRTINNFIDLTDINLGACELKLGNYNIVDVIRCIVENAASVVCRTDTKFIFYSDVSEKIMAFDLEKLERIIMNLLSNAVKFTDGGNEIYTIIKDSGDCIYISVKDKGCGIPKDKLGSIFEVFTQTEDPFTRSHEGSGIGLAIAKAFVEQHKGSISVESRKGKGTKVTIILPVNVLAENNIKNYEEYETDILQKIQVEFSDICEINSEVSAPLFSRAYPPPRISGVS